MTDDKSSTPHLIFAQQDAVATVSINSPPMNPMSLEFFDELEALVPKLSADRSVRAVVITAEGEDNFSVGMNLKQMAGMGHDPKRIQDVLDQRLRVESAIETMGKPVVATLFGYCLGGGLELPLSCHFRLAAEEGAKIGLPELELGTVSAWGGSARLTRCVGRLHALDMILRAKMISGPEAYRIGLVNDVFPNAELKARAHELAKELSCGGYLEDPTAGLENMAQVRKRLMAEGITTPLATNVAVTLFADIPRALELDAIQVILCDHHYWGGMRQVRHLANLCKVFGIGLSMHSNSHLGVSLMAMAHVAAATPHLTYACDTHYPW